MTKIYREINILGKNWKHKRSLYKDRRKGKVEKGFSGSKNYNKLVLQPKMSKAYSLYMAIEKREVKS